MKRIGTYKSFKLYEVTEKDIRDSGGAESTYVKGSILIFLPDEDNPSFRYEEWNADSMEEAKDFVDSHDVVMNREKNKKNVMKDTEQIKEDVTMSTENTLNFKFNVVEVSDKNKLFIKGNSYSYNEFLSLIEKQCTSNSESVHAIIQSNDSYDAMRSAALDYTLDIKYTISETNNNIESGVYKIYARSKDQAKVDDALMNFINSNNLSNLDPLKLETDEDVFYKKQQKEFYENIENHDSEFGVDDDREMYLRCERSEDEFETHQSSSINIKLLYEMIGYKLNGKLCFTTFEMLENELEKGSLLENIKAFSNLSDEEKQLMADDFEVNFKLHQEDYEWNEFYRDNVANYEQITEIFNFEHTDISVDGHSGRWHSIMETPNRWNNEFKEGEPFYLVKHDTLDVPYAIINEELRVVAHEAPNGFKDLDLESELSFDEDECEI